MQRGIYVHIPFCSGKCFYCDFHSVTAKESLLSSYISALGKEIDQRSKEVENQTFDSVYIGGGTPSILGPDLLYQLGTRLKERFSLSRALEFTLEANPFTLTKEKIDVIKGFGVNRVSLGAQSFDDTELKRLGRLHKKEDIYQAVNMLQEAKLGNISLDLILGLPSQTRKTLQNSLREATSLPVTHMSCYALLVPEGTPFHQEQEQGTLHLPSDDQVAFMLEEARTRLKQRGFFQYEIANFAKEDKKSVHNQIYWRNEPYLALGSGAYGYESGVRYANTEDISLYIAAMNKGETCYGYKEEISRDLEMDETMMMGLRLVSGVSAERFLDRFGVSFFTIYGKEVEKLQSRGLLEYKEGSLRLTKEGLLLGNLVFQEFLRGVL